MEWRKQSYLTEFAVSLKQLAFLMHVNIGGRSQRHSKHLSTVSKYFHCSIS